MICLYSVSRIRLSCSFLDSSLWFQSVGKLPEQITDDTVNLGQVYFCAVNYFVAAIARPAAMWPLNY